MAVRVFVVEDQKPMPGLITDLLESVGGFEIVGIAGNETSATDWLYRHRGGWDLAIVDLLLGEGSGFPLVSRCNKEPGGAVLVHSHVVVVADEHVAAHRIEHEVAARDIAVTVATQVQGAIGVGDLVGDLTKRIKSRHRLAACPYLAEVGVAGRVDQRHQVAELPRAGSPFVSR